MNRQPTISDVARMAGVSVATASRALNGTRRVNLNLRGRVLTAADRLGYAPNPHARALAQARDASIGVVVHDVSDPYFSEIVRGMLAAANERERMILICHTSRDPGRELSYVAHFRAQRTEALVLAGSGLEDRDFGARMASEVLAFESAGGRVAFIGRHYAPGDAVIPDNVGGARTLARHLAELGHRRVGVISGPGHLTTTHDRLMGFRMGLRELGVELDPEHMTAGDFTREGGARGALELLRRDPELTAIWALNDVMAVGALGALRSAGMNVPGDVTLCGFDDVALATDVDPALTTVRVPMAEMGARALDLALQPRESDIRTEHLPTELVVRGTSGRPRR